MRNGEITTTVAGNLTGDPELRFTPISREFAITEALLGWNPRVDGL
jgi:single-stranded DNA-binding protein